MHTQDDGIQLRGNALRMPAYGIGKNSVFCQTPFRGLENLVVGTGDLIAFQLQGNGQIVHGAAANGNKVYFHRWFGFESAKIVKN